MHLFSADWKRVIFFVYIISRVICEVVITSVRSGALTFATGLSSGKIQKKKNAVTYWQSDKKRTISEVENQAI